MTTYRVKSGGALRGTIRVDGDKSVSHRAVLLAALASGESQIRGLLAAADVESSIAAVRACGVGVAKDTNAECWRIKGTGKLASPKGDIDCGNSGTLMRLFCGVAAGWGINCRLVGDSSLMRRPMARVAEPLRRMGADITTAAGGRPPVAIRAVKNLRGMQFNLPVASAQVKSALLLAGLRAAGDKTAVCEPAQSRDHTEKMLAAFGVEVIKTGDSVAVRGGAKLKAAKMLNVPADISSAAFFILAATIATDADITLPDVGVNPTRIGVIKILKRMGANIALSNRREYGAEPVADIRVRSAKEKLRGTIISADEVPAAIDEFPVIFAAAAVADGETVISGAGELRVKESDRIGAMANALSHLGANIQTRPDGAIIKGGKLHGGTADARGDHRIAMATAATAAAIGGDEIVIRACENVKTSFPNFPARARDAGLDLQEEEE